MHYPILLEKENGQIGEQALHPAVRQLAALDTGTSSNAFYGRHPPQRRKALRRERSQGPPCAFEFVNPGNQPQDLERDLECLNVTCNQHYTH